MESSREIIRERQKFRAELLKLPIQKIFRRHQISYSVVSAARI